MLKACFIDYFRSIGFVLGIYSCANQGELLVISSDIIFDLPSQYRRSLIIVFAIDDVAKGSSISKFLCSLI